MSQDNKGNSVSKVPHRPFGTKTETLGENSSLSPSVPILGLGCSSFSTFFWNEQEQSDNRATVASSADTNSSAWTRNSLDQGHPIVKEWIETIVEAIAEHGITLLDTAPWYGHGTSEIAVGWGLAELKKRFPDIERSNLTINTKIGRYEADPSQQFDFSYDKTIASAQTSLERLQLEYIDVLQVHDPEFAPSLNILFQETIPALLHCRKQGWCKALGMTGYPLPVQHQILQKTLEYDWNTATGTTVDPTTIWDQALTYGHFNLHDKSLLSTRFITPSSKTAASLPDAKLSYYDYCRNGSESGSIRILAAAPLSMGLLTHNDPPEWHPASSELQHACRSAAGICKERNVDIAILAILFAMSHPGIPCTILGIKDRQQLQVATELANRFHASPNDCAQEEMLERVLTEMELQSWKLLADPTNGPFSSVWKKGESYQWDGIECVREFWNQVEDSKVEEWQAV